jgi:hypothetical protein
MFQLKEEHDLTILEKLVQFSSCVHHHTLFYTPPLLELLSVLITDFHNPNELTAVPPSQAKYHLCSPARADAPSSPNFPQLISFILYPH